VTPPKKAYKEWIRKPRTQTRLQISFRERAALSEFAGWMAKLVLLIMIPLVQTATMLAERQSRNQRKRLLKNADASHDPPTTACDCLPITKPGGTPT